MSDSKWKMLSAMPGEFSVKVAGGTVAFIESPSALRVIKGDHLRRLRDPLQHERAIMGNAGIR
ncbi:hypothetical protein ECDEC6C_0003 [Escherichia coli DEC6C]|nr:hypothetical protein ECDEC6C_0003 [Escherichia coli DEC6C]